MEVVVTGPVIEWRGPAPFYFVTLPHDEADRIAEVAAAVTYGWGMIPVTCRLGDTTWTTSLWPRQDSYVIPIKDKVRTAETIALGDVVSVTLTLQV